MLESTLTWDFKQILASHRPPVNEACNPFNSEAGGLQARPNKAERRFRTSAEASVAHPSHHLAFSERGANNPHVTLGLFLDQTSSRSLMIGVSDRVACRIHKESTVNDGLLAYGSR